MKKLNIYRISAFTDNPFQGNPAAVIRSDELNDQEMSLIAREMNLSESSFLSRSEIADYKLRWYTPLTEVDLCGHGTIAAMHFLKESGELQNNCALRFETKSGIIRCAMENDMYFMQIPAFNFMRFDSTDSELIPLLGLDQMDITGDFFLLDNGYLYVQVDSLGTLGKIDPDYANLKNFISSSGLSGIAAYTTETYDSDNSAHLRFFAPNEGIEEDPVTGSANGPLIKILCETGAVKRAEIIELQFEQGDFVGRPGRIKVLYRNGKIFIAGMAVTFFRGEIFI